MPTERLSPRYRDIDAWEAVDILKALHEGQLAAVAAVGPAIGAIAAAAEAAVPRLRAGGRLVYAGAGTSARIAVQDGVELCPTFGWPEERLAFAVAGGDGAFLRAVENAEDCAEDGVARAGLLAIGPSDVVIALAASGATPFTLGVVGEARARGALTLGVANNPQAPLLAAAEHPVLVDTGEEAVAGSTRMKAGTAQKVVLNLFSTLVMVRLGRVYRGMMVRMRSTNAKLRRRGALMVAELAGCPLDRAAAAAEAAGGDVALAVVMARGLERAAAEALLERHDGSLRGALDSLAGLPP
ncbi:MAG: N-acetylmuramic acid 6-phosphate etherase [Thalassobaculales bacterium]